MSSADRPGPADRALLAAGTATYDWHDFETLDKVPEALRAVVDTLARTGVFHRRPEPRVRPRPDCG